MPRNRVLTDNLFSAFFKTVGSSGANRTAAHRLSNRPHFCNFKRFLWFRRHKNHRLGYALQFDYWTNRIRYFENY